MRDTLRTKFTKRGSNAILDYAVSSMQDYKDAFTTVEDFDVSTSTSFFGVYDGHGGRAVSKYCGKHFHKELLKHKKFDTDLRTALKEVFFRMDKLLRTNKAQNELTELGDKDYRARNNGCPHLKKPPGPLDEGTSACIAIIRGNQIIVGNAGDSRCVLSRNGYALDLSTDHKPNVVAEQERIQKAGLSMSFNNELCIGNQITISRSIGDLKYKKNKKLGPELQAITCAPDIRDDNINDRSQFLILASSGVWGGLGSQPIVDFVHTQMDESVDLGSISESVLDRCNLSSEKMVFILIRFKNANQCPERRNLELGGPLNDPHTHGGI